MQWYESYKNVESLTKPIKNYFSTRGRPDYTLFNDKVGIRELDQNLFEFILIFAESG